MSKKNLRKSGKAAAVGTTVSGRVAMGEESISRAGNEAAPDEIILIALVGMTPANLTETLWALASPSDGTEPLIPTRVIALTTAQGRGHVLQLFNPSPRLGNRTPWDALRQALKRQGHNLRGKLRFGSTADDIRVISSADDATGRSVELADIRDRADNEAAADFILDQVRTIVENPDTRLIASIAGGRKTMSALLYACMTLAGRETDRLTHVLVDEPYESLRDFWFPTQPGSALKDREGNSHKPSDARVGLVHVPFVPLRNLFRRELGQPAGSFRRLMDLCRANVRMTAGEHLRLEIEKDRPRSIINGRALELSPREHMVLLFFAQRTLRGETVLGAFDEAIVDLEEYRKSLRRTAPPDDWSDWRSSAGMDRQINDRDLVRILSDVRTKAKRAGGGAAFLANVLPAKGRCALDIPASMISIK